MRLCQHSALSVLLCLTFTACSDDSGRQPDSGTQSDGQTQGDLATSQDAPPAQKVEAYFPKDDEITGWSEDSSTGQPGVEAGYTKSEIEALIDGKHDPYDAEGCAGFAMEHYIKDYGQSCQGKLTLYMWEMNSAAGAKKMFDKDKSDGETQSGLTFETISGVTEEGILAFDAVFIAYAHKNAYIMQLSAEVTGATCGTDVKEDVKTWVQHVTQSLP